MAMLFRVSLSITCEVCVYVCVRVCTCVCAYVEEVQVNTRRNMLYIPYKEWCDLGP